MKSNATPYPEKPLRFSPKLTAAGIEPILLTVPDAAQCLGVGTRTMYTLISEHRLPAGCVDFSLGKIRIKYAVLKRHYDRQAA